MCSRRLYAVVVLVFACACDGAIRNGGCPTGEHDDGTGRCTTSGCAMGYQPAGDGGACLASSCTCVKQSIAGCGPAEHDDGTGKCVTSGCAAGYHLLGGDCIVRVAQVAAGPTHTCAVTGTGKVYCWGANARGQLGDGSTTDHISPLPVFGLSGVQAVATGCYHTCALTVSGGVKCWGDNAAGQLGDGTTMARPSPVDVMGLQSGVRALALGFEHTCALLAGGAVKCWGDNERGQLGDGTTMNRSAATDVTGLSGGVAAITAGIEHTCASTTTGGVKCWGWNRYGEVGNGSMNEQHTPVDVVGLMGITQVAAGSWHTCALDDTGAVWCWGHDDSGELGDGAMADRASPVRASGLGPAEALATGDGFTCARVAGVAASLDGGVADGGMPAGAGVSCWGRNDHGALGDGTMTTRATPGPVTLAAPPSDLVAGGYHLHTCAIVDASLVCWGANAFGQLGDGTTTDSTIPVNVEGFR